MDLLQTLLVYMTVAVSSTLGAAPMPTATPVPTAAPTAVVTPAPVTETPVTAEPVTPTSAPEATERPQITANPGYGILRPKMEGEAVKQMQLRLKELGYLTGEADGVFGNQTKSAVLRFQKAHGLTRDGVAGPATLTILYEDPNVVWGPAAAPTPTAEPTPEPTAEPTQEPTPEPAIEPTALPEPTLVPPLEAGAEVPLHEAGPVAALVADGRVMVNGTLLEAADLVGLSAEMDVLVDMLGLAQAMSWPVESAGTEHSMQVGDHRVVWDYTLAANGALDLVTVNCDGEPVELTEAMTALVQGRLFLSPLWLESLGAQTQWNPDHLTLAVTLP